MKKELLTCCRTDAELEQMRLDEQANDFKAIRRCQSNLVAEKPGFRCTTCGRLYPILEAHYKGRPIDLKALSRPLGRRLKLPKAALVFRGDHYYAVCRKSLLRYDLDPGGNAVLTEEIPIMGQVWYAAVSPSGRYIATETGGGTAAIVDAVTKETLLKRKNLCAGDTLRFADEETLLYFRRDEGLFCWRFQEEREDRLWQPPQNWLAPDQQAVTCHGVLETEPGRLVFQLSSCAGDFALVTAEGQAVELVPLPKMPTLAEMTWHAGRYVLPQADRVLVLDREFRLVDTFPFPEKITRNDGGGVFPIDTFTEYPPQRVHLSADGKWVFVDHGTMLLLLDREADAVRYAVWSNNFTSGTKNGILSDGRIWYNWAASTYIMET